MQVYRTNCTHLLLFLPHTLWKSVGNRALRASSVSLSSELTGGGRSVSAFDVYSCGEAVSLRLSPCRKRNLCRCQSLMSHSSSRCCLDTLLLLCIRWCFDLICVNSRSGLSDSSEVPMTEILVERHLLLFIPCSE